MRDCAHGGWHHVVGWFTSSGMDVYAVVAATFPG